MYPASGTVHTLFGVSGRRPFSFSETRSGGGHGVRLRAGEPPLAVSPEGGVGEFVDPVRDLVRGAGRAVEGDQHVVVAV